MAFAQLYHDHVSITAPSRSGTTHLTIEAILQTGGWNEGWGIIKAFSGNLRNITERSFGVPDAVNSGQVGYGIVIDFFAYSAQGAGFPIKFAYPTLNALVPANVGIVKNGPNPAGARAFVEFLLSPQGQETLFEPTIRRLPVLPSVYAKAPAGLPNPFDLAIASANQAPFNVDLSERRYTVVDVLYDQLVSFHLDALKRVTKTLHDAEARLARRDNPQARGRIAEARALITAMPITEAEAASDEIVNAFKGGGAQGPRSRTRAAVGSFAKTSTPRHRPSDEACGLQLTRTLRSRPASPRPDTLKPQYSKRRSMSRQRESQSVSVSLPLPNLPSCPSQVASHQPMGGMAESPPFSSLLVFVLLFLTPSVIRARACDLQNFAMCSAPAHAALILTILCFRDVGVWPRVRAPLGYFTTRCDFKARHIQTLALSAIIRPSPGRRDAAALGNCSINLSS